MNTEDRPFQEARIIAVDPGAVHVGVAEFETRPVVYPDDPGWACTRTYETGPFEFAATLETQLAAGDWDVVVYETFQIYPDKAMAQTGSKCETAQLIGIIRWLVSKHPEVDLVEQPAAIQKPTLGILRTNKIQSRAKADRAGEHALSAELHGHCFLRQNGLVR